jgi:hypothetical protein
MDDMITLAPGSFHATVDGVRPLTLPLAVSPLFQILTTFQTAYIIKWAVIGAIFVAFLAFFLGGYLHAKSRMKKGLAPLAYHRVRPLPFHLFHLHSPLAPFRSFPHPTLANTDSSG